MKIVTRLVFATIAGLFLFQADALGQVVLWDNGPIVNCEGCGTGDIAGADLSQAATGIELGQGHRQFNGQRVADDFEVGPGGWWIDTAEFYAYQTQMAEPFNTTSTITGVTLRIWDGEPGVVGSSVIFGDEDTDRMISTQFSGIYRMVFSTTTSAQRPVMVQTVDVGIHLTEGTYWLDWSSSVSVEAQAWVPPITLPDPTNPAQRTTGDAVKREGPEADWEPVVFEGFDKGLPFVLNGFADERQEVGESGWRMLSPPVIDATVQDLADLAIIQGLPDEYPIYDTNIFTNYNGNNADNTGGNDNGFVPPTGLEAALPPGRGFFWYLWEQEITYTHPSGQSQGPGLPLVIAVTGTAPTGEVTTEFLEGERHETDDDGFFLIGNPFDELAFDVAGVDASSGTLSTVFHRWNPNLSDGNGAYEILDAAEGDRASRWDGLFAQVTDPDFPLTFTFDDECADLDGCPNGPRPSGERYRVALTLKGTVGDVKAFDEAAMVVFASDASLGWDRRDASKLNPMGWPWAIIAPMGDRFGEQVAKAVESRPLPTGLDVVPVAFSAMEPGDFTISLGQRTDVPQSWTIELVDTATGAVVDLRGGSVTFSVNDLVWMDERFELRVGGEPISTDPGSSPYTFGIEAAYPNPFVSRTRVVFALEEAGDATLGLYDVLGRRVAILAEGEHAAGQHSVSLDASGMASGVYVVRLSSAGQAQSQRITLLR